MTHVSFGTIGILIVLVIFAVVFFIRDQKQLEFIDEGARFTQEEGDALEARIQYIESLHGI